MISVSDAARFAEESTAVKKFIPWWEIVIDYLTLGLLLMTLLSWTRVISAASSGLICLPLDTTIAYSYNFANYFNSRCAQEFNARLLLYYPYLLFLQWITIFVIQRTWLKVPAVSTKFDSYHDIFHDMYKIQPRFHRDPYNLRMLPEFNYDVKQKTSIKVLQDKLMFLLTDRSYLIWVYVAKVNLLFIVCLTFFCFMIYWALSLNFLRADFRCVLKDTDRSITPITILVCNFSSAYLLYGVIIINITLLVLILMSTFYGFYWIITQRRFLDKKDIFGHMHGYYAGLPGYNDLQFCMALIKGNVKDGNIMQEVIKTCLKGKTEQLDDAAEEEVDNKTPHRNERSFKEEHAILRCITDQLGLEDLRNDQSPKHLFDCLKYMKGTLPGYDLDVTTTMRDKVAREIQQNVLQFKSIIDNDPNSPDYHTVIKNIQNQNLYGSQYAVIAASNILNIRIVIIHCHSADEFNEVFEPFETSTTGFELETRFLTFVRPHYYHATRFIKVFAPNTDEIEEKRQRYVRDERFRHILRQASVRQVVKHVAIEEKGRRRRKRVSTEQDVDFNNLMTLNPAMGKCLLQHFDLYYDDTEGKQADKPAQIHFSDLPDYFNTATRNKSMTKIRGNDRTTNV